MNLDSAAHRALARRVAAEGSVRELRRMAVAAHATSLELCDSEDSGDTIDRKAELARLGQAG